MTNIELTEETREEINKHITALMEIAQIYQIPLFYTMVLKNTEMETQYIKGIFSAQSGNIELADDRIRKHLLVEAGFELIPPRENLTVSMEDIVYGA